MVKREQGKGEKNEEECEGDGTNFRRKDMTSELSNIQSVFLFRREKKKDKEKKTRITYSSQEAQFDQDNKRGASKSGDTPYFAKPFQFYVFRFYLRRHRRLEIAFSDFSSSICLITS